MPVTRSEPEPEPEPEPAAFDWLNLILKRAASRTDHHETGFNSVSFLCSLPYLVDEDVLVSFGTAQSASLAFCANLLIKFQ